MRLIDADNFKQVITAAGEKRGEPWQTKLICDLIDVQPTVHDDSSLRVPKRPRLEGDGYDPEGNLVYDMWICPNCDWRYDVDDDDYCYCPNCGQKIDWSNMEGNGEGYEEDCE